MKKFGAKNIIIAIIIIILMLFGCAETDEIPISVPTEVVSTETPFFLSTQEISGGDGLSSLNLADIKIEPLDDNKVKLTLSFMTGSGTAMVEQQISNGVPNYLISHIEGVDRMVIKLDGISGWTYRIYEDEIQNNNIIKGMLRQEPSGSDSMYLYVSTRDDYTYRVDTNSNKIEITFNHIPENENYKYYIKVNAFLEYQNGVFTHDDFYPCISNDGVNGVLLSLPFDTLEEAQEYVESNSDNFAETINLNEISVIYLGNNEIPEYNYENQLEQIINTPIGIDIDDEIIGDALITEGRFLSWSNKKQEFVYSKPYTILGSQAGDVYSYEEIWLRNEEQDINLVEQQFTSILSASYSHDDRYVAFIDQNDETRILHVVNTETGELYVPSDSGFGIDTSSFVWSKTDNMLYAITGSHDSKQLLCYDMRDINNLNVCALTEEEYMESSLYVDDEYIYYLRADEDSFTTDIIIASLETGQGRTLMSGNSFMLSSDGKNILINDMHSDDVSEYKFYVYNTETKETNSILQSKMIMDYTFSKNDTRVYYTVYKNAGWEEEYPLALYYYDINKNQSYYMMDIITGALYPAYTDEEVLIMCIHQLQDKEIAITYHVR